MTSRIILTIAASLVTISASMHVAALPHQAVAQTSGDGAWTGRTLWGDPDLQGEWTAEGEYGVPFERPPQFGTRQLLTDEEYAKRLEDVRIREDNAGVYEYACHEGNHGMRYMLSASRHLERTGQGGTPAPEPR